MPSGEPLRFESHALGRTFHAAHVRLGPRSGGSDLHGHADFYELMGVVDGCGEHHAGSGSHPLEPGDVVLVRPRDRHAIAGRPPRGLAFVNVAFPAPAWEAFVDLTHADPEGTWNRRREPPLLSLRGRQAAAAQAAFDRALTAFQRTPTMLDLVRFWSDVLDLAADTDFGRLPGTDGDAGAGTTSAVRIAAATDSDGAVRPEWLVRARAAMHREENLRDGVARLRELASVSAAHLARSMREHYATSPTRFVTALRLERACALLATTDLTVTAIAHRCGFASQSYFTRCFRAAHGVSPRAFRQRARRAFVP
ncbi:helix-turn-helix domain-containing protein [Actinopolymorpha pittospori]